MTPNFLAKLAALARDNGDVRTLLREFREAGRMIAHVECDEVASRETGELVVRGRPSEAFRIALAKVLGAGGHDLNGRPTDYKSAALPD